MKRVLFVQASVNPPGGANAVATWMLDALAPDHDVTLLCAFAPRWPDIDAYYGTRLAPRPPRVQVAWTALAGLPLPLRFARAALLQRQARAMADGFDLLVAADGEADLGPRGLSYVHSPTPHLTRPERDPPFWRAPYPATTLYLRTIARLAGHDVARLRRSRLLTNSHWTAAWIERVHGARPAVLYPPVPGAALVRPWSERQDAVINIGRFSGEKRQVEAIDVVARVRAAGVPLTLTLVASRWDDAIERDVRRHAADKPWVQIVTDAPRARLDELLASHRYGLHTMVDEHFGIAPAESARAGCIVFVPDDGGQVEIVNGDRRLLFARRAEAADKLATVARSPTLQAELLALLAPARARFGTARFRDEFRALVAATT